jgi:NADPH:quinone reductase-like Zn-dependent oxidoreductase
MTNQTVSTQRAIAFSDYGGPEVLRLTDVPVPSPGTGAVRVRVAAAGVNQADWRLRSGQFRRFLRLRFPYVPGSDAAGVVDAVGEGVTDVRPGDRVIAYSPAREGGAYAPYLVVPADRVAVLPDPVPFVAGAALPLAGLTALQALHRRAGLRAGQHVLVHGAGGGVGHLAVQIARALGARVTAAAGARHAEFLRGLGADRVLDRERDDLAAAGPGYDVVLDASGLLGLSAARRLLRPGGVAVTVNPVAGLIHPDALAPLRGGRRLRSVAVRPDRDGLVRLAGWAGSGTVSARVTATWPVGEAAAAHRASETLTATGKLVLVVDPDLAGGRQ